MLSDLLTTKNMQIAAVIAAIIAVVVVVYLKFVRTQGFVSQFGDYPDSISTITQVEGALPFPGVNDVPVIPGPEPAGI